MPQLIMNLWRCNRIIQGLSKALLSQIQFFGTQVCQALLVGAAELAESLRSLQKEGQNNEEQNLQMAHNRGFDKIVSSNS